MAKILQTEDSRTGGSYSGWTTYGYIWYGGKRYKYTEGHGVFATRAVLEYDGDGDPPPEARSIEIHNMPENWARMLVGKMPMLPKNAVEIIIDCKDCRQYKYRHVEVCTQHHHYWDSVLPRAMSRDPKARVLLDGETVQEIVYGMARGGGWQEFTVEIRNVNGKVVVSQKGRPSNYHGAPPVNVSPEHGEVGVRPVHS